MLGHVIGKVDEEQSIKEGSGGVGWGGGPLTRQASLGLRAEDQPLREQAWLHMLGGCGMGGNGRPWGHSTHPCHSQSKTGRSWGRGNGCNRES